MLAYLYAENIGTLVFFLRRQYQCKPFISNALVFLPIMVFLLNSTFLTGYPDTEQT